MLEIFNDVFNQQTLRSEQQFTNNVGGEYIKTIRLSAEQWQDILKRTAIEKSRIEAANTEAVNKAKQEMADFDKENDQ